MKTKSFVSYVYRCGNMLLKICAIHGVKTHVLPKHPKGIGKPYTDYRTITITCDEDRMKQIADEWMESMRIKS